MTRNSDRNTDGAFAPGNSGKPKGARLRATMAAAALLDGEADGLTRKPVELALAGDVTALRMCLDRPAPAPKDTPAVLALAPLTGAYDEAQPMAALVASVASGGITPGEAAGIASVGETWRKAHETDDMEDRPTALKQRASPSNDGSTNSQDDACTKTARA
jgi:hypothetical protein